MGPVATPEPKLAPAVTFEAFLAQSWQIREQITEVDQEVRVALDLSSCTD
jgi:hypothetical protein